LGVSGQWPGLLGRQRLGIGCRGQGATFCIWLCGAMVASTSL
jgi:hypothetical protein